MSDQLTTKAEAGADDKRDGKPSSGRGYNARAGETIAGNLARGGDGKFTSAGNASAAKPKPTTGRRAVDLQKRRQKPPKGRAAAKPKPRKGPDPAKAAEREKRRQEAEARRRQREQDKLDRAVANEQKRRQQLADREARADAQAKRRAEVEARRAKREADKLARQQQPKGGGGKGGGAKKPSEPATPTVTTPALAGLTKRLSDGETLSEQDATALIRNGLARRDRDGNLALTVQGLRATRQKEAPRFVVYKDAAGRDRWVASSSTAFEDKDQEVVSRAALEADVARTDAAGNHGPLRFWHVPGWDIGDCDFRVVHGRTLIESGTFRKPEYAAAIKEGDQVSLGFLHPASEPSPDGVFNTIYTFERSITPAGRASNPFTRLALKEVNMLTPEKRAEFEARLGPAAVASILGEVEKTEKAAESMGVRHKGNDQPERIARWDHTSQQWVETTKAAMPPEMAAAMDAKAEGDGGEMIETEGIEEPLDGELASEYLTDMTPDEFFTRQAEVITAALAPLIGALDIESKMRGVVEEVKGIAGGFQTTKDAADAERAQQIEALSQQLAALKAEQAATVAKIKELEGDQPAALNAGYRASLNGPAPTGEALKSAPRVDPEMAQFFSNAFSQ